LGAIDFRMVFIYFFLLNLRSSLTYTQKPIPMSTSERDQAGLANLETEVTIDASFLTVSLGENNIVIMLK